MGKAYEITLPPIMMEVEHDPALYIKQTSLGGTYFPSWKGIGPLAVSVGGRWGKPDFSLTCLPTSMQWWVGICHTGWTLVSNSGYFSLESRYFGRTVKQRNVTYSIPIYSMQRLGSTEFMLNHDHSINN